MCVIQGTIERITDDETAIMTAKMVSDRYPLGRYKLDSLSLAVSKTYKWQNAIEDSEGCDSFAGKNLNSVPQRSETVCVKHTLAFLF